MIPNQKVQEVLEASRIEDVIGEFVTLKKAGVNYKALSPFSNEKTPSFIVSPTKQIFKDFSSGNGGNVVTFIMEHEGYNFVEAIKWLADRYNIEIEEVELTNEEIEKQKQVDSFYIVNDFATKFFQSALFESEEGRIAGLSYFKERGFLEATIKKFQLGYAPKGPSSLTNKAIKKGYKEPILQKIGLTNSYSKDFFKERVMFPIHNISGKVLGFGGRILSSEKKIAKYINSPETEIYNKSKILYGAHFAKQAIRKEDNCLMVEGYTDVLSLHQNGIENVVASSGTALTEQQVRLVKRYTDNITILYDGDPAGIKAALRGLNIVLQQDMNVRVCILPNGTDPDSYVREIGADAFKDYIAKQAKDFILFKTNMLLEEAKNDPIAKSKLIKDIIETISLINDPIKRSIYIRESAQKFDTRETLINNEVNKLIRKDITKQQNKRENEAQKKRSLPTDNTSSDDGYFPTQAPADALEADLTQQQSDHELSTTGKDEHQEKDIIRLIMLFGDRKMKNETSVLEYIMLQLEGVFEYIDNTFYSYLLKQTLEYVGAKEKPAFSYYLNHEDKRIKQLAVEFVEQEFSYSPNWKEKLNYDLQGQPHPEENHDQDTIKGTQRFRLKKIIRALNANQERIKEADKYGNTDDIIKLLSVQQKLIAIRDELAATMKRVVL